MPWTGKPCRHRASSQPDSVWECNNSRAIRKLCFIPSQEALAAAAEMVAALQGHEAAAQLRGPALAPAEVEARRLRLPHAEPPAAASTRRLAEAVLAAYARLATLSSCAVDLRCASELRPPQACSWAPTPEFTGVSEYLCQCFA